MTNQAPERIAALSPVKRKLLGRLLRERASEFNSFPLSFAQQRLWFFDQLVPGSALYNVPAALRLTGQLNVAALEQSLNEIVRRHEILRTAFLAVDGRPVQVIRPASLLPLPVTELQNLPQGERLGAAQRLAAEEARRPFDLARGPLLRTGLLRLGEAEHVFLLTMHHIVADAWSLGILIHELGLLYEAGCSGRPSRLAGPPIQYADFSVWQRQWLGGEVLDRQLAYWRQQIDGAAVLQLPTDRPRPAAASFRGAKQLLLLPGTLAEALAKLSRQEGVTLFMTLLAAFKTLLYRYTGQDDVLVLTSVANRNRVETEGLIGLFINLLALRTDLSSDPSFRDLLGRVRRVVLGAYAHQDLPFEKLVEELRPDRGPGQGTLAPVAFTLQNASKETVQFPGLTLDRFEADGASTAKTDLMLYMAETESGLAASLEYNADLFDAATVSLMLQYFQTMLESIVADPGQRLSRLPPAPAQAALCAAPAQAAPPAPVARGAAIKSAASFERSNLTNNQLLFWLGQKLQPEAPLYNMANTFLIRDSIDLAHLRRAFRTLVNSSDALRTVIEESDGVPQQRVMPEMRFELEYVDFSQASEPQAALKTWIDNRCQAAFDLSERLFDSALIKLSGQQFVWYLNHHQLIADAWSTYLIYRRLAEFYGRSLKRELPDRVELPAFQGYVTYEREQRRSARYRRAVAYWEQKLSEELAPITFYGKSSRGRTTRGERISCPLGAQRMQALRAKAAQEGIFVGTADLSLFNIFAALLFAYLYRISGSRRLSLGVAHHNRVTRAFTETIGFLMEVLPVPITVSCDETFLSLIKKVAGETLAALKHGQYSVSSPARQKTHHAMLNFINAPGAAFNGTPVAVEWVHPGYQDEPLALHVHRFDASDDLALEFDFDCDIFSAEQRGQAIKHFLRLLDAFLNDSQTPIGQADLLLTESQRQRSRSLENEAAFDF